MDIRERDADLIAQRKRRKPIGDEAVNRLSPEREARLRALVKEGKTTRQIAAIFGCTYENVRYLCRVRDLKPNRGYGRSDRQGYINGGKAAGALVAAAWIAKTGERNERIWALYLQGKRYDDIAAELGLESRGTVAGVVYRRWHKEYGGKTCSR